MFPKNCLQHIPFIWDHKQASRPKILTRAAFFIMAPKIFMKAPQKRKIPFFTHLWSCDISNWSSWLQDYKNWVSSKKKLGVWVLGAKKGQKRPNLALFLIFHIYFLQIKIEKWNFRYLVHFHQYFHKTGKNVFLQKNFYHSWTFVKKSVFLYFFLHFLNIFLNLNCLQRWKGERKKSEYFPQTAYNMCLSFETINKLLDQKLWPAFFIMVPKIFMEAPQNMKNPFFTHIWSCDISN